MPNLNPITRKEAILNGDDVIPKTREEHFAKKAVSGGGSGGSIPTPTAEDAGKVLTAGADGTASWQSAGGGLPEYSSSDAGKVLTVAKVSTPSGATIVEEQTITINSHGEASLAASSYDFSPVNVGDTVGAVVEGAVYSAEVVSGYGGSKIVSITDLSLEIASDGSVSTNYYAPGSAITLTISQSVTESYEAGWEKPYIAIMATGTGSYDAGTDTYTFTAGAETDFELALLDPANIKPVYAIFPLGSSEAPYYTYENGAATIIQLFDTMGSVEKTVSNLKFTMDISNMEMTIEPATAP